MSPLGNRTSSQKPKLCSMKSIPSAAASLHVVLLMWPMTLRNRDRLGWLVDQGCADDTVEQSTRRVSAVS